VLVGTGVGVAGATGGIATELRCVALAVIETEADGAMTEENDWFAAERQPTVRTNAVESKRMTSE
jgi:hypothetical protein